MLAAILLMRRCMFLRIASNWKAHVDSIASSLEWLRVFNKIYNNQMTRLE